MWAVALEEGRVITVELPQSYVVAAYVPNSGQVLERLDFRTQVWEPVMLEYLCMLEVRYVIAFALHHLLSALPSFPIHIVDYSRLIGVSHMFLSFPLCRPRSRSFTLVISTSHTRTSIFTPLKATIAQLASLMKSGKDARKC